MYDYLIVGSGLYGAVVGYELSKIGKKCIVVEKRSHIGGNIFTEAIEGINVHKYGAHIFHTSDEHIWNYINQFADFNNYINSPLANYKGVIYNLPFNMNTFSKMWGISSPAEAKKIIDGQRAEITGEPKNLEEQAISLVGRDIYEKLIKEYTEKQWGRDCRDIPAFIIKRIPVRFTYDNNYFNDRYQGIPIGGYTQIIDKMLSDCEILLNVNYLENKEKWNSSAARIIYTGPIDAYFSFTYGVLQYRSLSFEIESLEIGNFQGNAVVNYTDKDTPYTRIIEHKHFEFGAQKNTVIAREFSKEWNTTDEPYYPINDAKNTELYARYKTLAELEKNVVFGGRLAEYKYYDMDEIIASARCAVETEINK
jgi:UDP-galactopyranose mutase